MVAYIKLGIAALLPAIMSGLLFFLDKKTLFGKLDNKYKQIIYGIIFGFLAIIGTEWGIEIQGAQMNCRDAAVLSAGLMFGAPAGIIAGLIGGVERWIAVAWGVGTFTRLACTLSTIIAGFYSALLRKFMFENKKPSWLLSLAIGVVMEVFHLTMVFITNMATPIKAIAVVKACTFPMVLANSISVMLSAIIISFILKEKLRKKQSNVRISQTIQGWLLVAVFIAFIATSFFVFSLQNQIADSQTDSLLDLSIKEVSEDIIDTVDFEKDINSQIIGITKNRHVGETGYVLVVDKNQNIISAPKNFDLKVVQSEIKNLTYPESGVTFITTLNKVPSFCRYVITENFYLISVLPKAEAHQSRNIALYVNSFMEILVFALLFGLIYLLIKKVVVNQIQSVNESLAKITSGNLDEIVNVRSNAEFASLSDDINSTVEALKKYIAEASARIDAELEVAKNIQKSVLPNTFQAFPKRRDFDIYAYMDSAKEVGGDFYDFYMTSSDKLYFLIADVSGKGIPAAMFMMRAKTELKNLTESDVPLCDVFTNGNNELYNGNDAGMFVTAWQGGIDLTTGLVQFVNAGHNPPLVRHPNGKFEYLKSRAGFVLAGIEGIKYKTDEIQLSPGDVIYLYTDGVTEATNSQNEFYGEERLLTAINSREFKDMEELCKYIKSDIEDFVKDAPQFDDITMVALKYIGSPSISFEKASIDDIPVVTEFIESELEKNDCPMKAVVQINIVIDEIYSNIVRYGYPDCAGPVTVKLIINDSPKTVYIRFEDEGIPYNPLVKEDPDVALSAEERNIGGLGIFLVKKTMDDIKYKYENGHNILTIKKII